MVVIALKLYPGLISAIMTILLSSITVFNPLTTIMCFRCYRQVTVRLITCGWYGCVAKIQTTPCAVNIKVTILSVATVADNADINPLVRTITNIATMDNGTLVEVFKSLNYCKLAKTGLVSKRFRDLIRNNRHRLALLYASEIGMDIFYKAQLSKTVFDKRLTPEEYDDWVIRNQYSKQIPLESQMAGLGSSLSEDCLYHLYAKTAGSAVFSVRTDVNNENWPLFHHFIRLLTDPFIYVRHVQFDWTAQKEVLNLLTGIINPDRNRLQCHAMKLLASDLDFPNLTNWAKCHLLCDELNINVYGNDFDQDPLNYDEALLDLIMTGGHCTSALNIVHCELSKILLDFSEKFMDFKNGDECKVVQSIKGSIDDPNEEAFKRQLGKFIVKEKRDVDEDNDEVVELVFEFVNKDIGQKCQFAVTYYDETDSETDNE